MVLALNDSNSIAKDLNFKALKVFSDFHIQSNVSLRLYCSQSSFRLSIARHWEVRLCGCSSDIYTFLHNLFWVCNSWLYWPFNFSFFFRLSLGEKSSQHFWCLYKLIMCWMGSHLTLGRLWHLFTSEVLFVDRCSINLILHIRHTFPFLYFLFESVVFLYSNVYRLSIDVLVTCLSWNWNLILSRSDI